MSKIAAVIQRPEETLTDFYERLCEAIRINTPFNPKAPEKPENGQYNICDSIIC
jgi:hypothetical protein